MKLYEQFINNLNEKASIDWNNYLTPEEVKRFKSKDDKIEAAGEIIYDKEFKDRLEDFKKSGWTDEQLIDDLFSFDLNKHLNLNESSDSYITLYHNTSNENAIKINTEGIIPGLKKDAYGGSADTEGSGIWCSTIRGYGYGGATITFKIAKDDPALEWENDTQYMVFREIKPNEIIDIDLMISTIVAMNSHNLVESDIPKAISKYGKDKFLDVTSKYSDKFVEPYNEEQLIHLIETGEKYCKGKISLLESYSINNLPKSVKDIKNMNQFFRDIINQEEDKYWREMLKDAYTCDRNILNPNETPLKRKREIVQKYLDKKHNLTEGVHLYAFVKDEDGNNKIIEDSDYPDKDSFKRDLQANGYAVRRINDEKDMYIMDHSDYRSLSEAKSKIKQIEKDIKDGIALPSEKIELSNLKDLLDKVNSLTESEKDRNAFELWKKQIASKSRSDLYSYYNRLVSQMKLANKSDRYSYVDLAKKINYIEDTYNIKNTFSYNLK